MIVWLINRGHVEVWGYGYSLFKEMAALQVEEDKNQRQWEASLHGAELKGE